MLKLSLFGLAWPLLIFFCDDGICGAIRSLSVKVRTSSKFACLARARSFVSWQGPKMPMMKPITKVIREVHSLTVDYPFAVFRLINF